MHSCLDAPACSAVETVPAVIYDIECEQIDNSKQGDVVKPGGGEYKSADEAESALLRWGWGLASPDTGAMPSASNTLASRLEVAGLFAGRQPRGMFGETCWPY